MNGKVHKILSKILGTEKKIFVKNQFCWTFRSALTLSSKSLATDVNTILYKLRFFGLNRFQSFEIHGVANCDSNYINQTSLKFVSFLVRFVRISLTFCTSKGALVFVASFGTLVV